MGDAFPRLDPKRAPAAIPARDQQLALVVRIDEPDQVAEDDAVPVAEAGAGQDDRRESRILQVDGHSGVDELAPTRGQQQRFIEASPQVDPRRAAGAAPGQRYFGSEPRIEHLQAHSPSRHTSPTLYCGGRPGQLRAFGCGTIVSGSDGQPA